MNILEYNHIGREILDACYQVHKELGPGLLESVYVFSLLKEFELRKLSAISPVHLPLFYKGHETGKHFEIDILVEKEIIIEVKAVETMNKVFHAQLLTYLKLADKKLGYLVNFNVPVLKDGFNRFVNNL